MTERAIGATNIAHIDSGHTHPTLMGKLDLDTPIYAHTGLGTIWYDGNYYDGVGNIAGLSGLEETENIVPAPVQLQLNGLDADALTASLDEASYGDRVTLYIGYRNDGGTLIDDPWVFYKGRVESSALVRGSENSISITVQHDLAVLKRKIGTKYTDEEQQRRYAGDTAFIHVSKMADIAKDLLWGASKGVSTSGQIGTARSYGRGRSLP